MKVLFLDIDGVLNSHLWRLGRGTRLRARAPKEIYDGEPFPLGHLRRGWVDIDPAAVTLLAVLLDAVPDCKIVLSSTWRLSYTLPQMRRLLKARGLGDRAERLIDRTPDLVGELADERGDEIAKWLLDHPEVTTYAVVDDTADMTAVRDHFVETSDATGLTEEDVKRLISLLLPE